MYFVIKRHDSLNKCLGSPGQLSPHISDRAALAVAGSSASADSFSSRRNCQNILISLCSSPIWQAGAETLPQPGPGHADRHAYPVVIAAFTRQCLKLLQFSAMTRIHSILATSVALLATLLPPVVDAADDQPLPWDGRFQDLTVDSLTDKYLTHILTNRQNGTVAPDQWVTITQKGRSPAFNDDTGVATLAVDSEAIFGGQTNFRRSELVQQVSGNTAGTTFFRVSLMKEEAYINKYSWQVIFPESHLFEIRIDASVDPVQLVWYTGGSTETRWSTEFKIETWYNFGIAVSSGKLALYFSEGDEALALTKTETYNGDVPSNYEFHFGQLTLSNDGSAVDMVAGKQDVLSFNGVSIEKSVPSDAGSTSSTTTSSSSGTSTSTTTPTVTTAAPTVTEAPATEATSTASEADEASEASDAADQTTDASEASSEASDAVDQTTDAPTATTAPSTSTTEASTETDTSTPTTDASTETDTSTPTTDAPATNTSGCKVRRN